MCSDKFKAKIKINHHRCNNYKKVDQQLLRDFVPRLSTGASPLERTVPQIPLCGV